MKHQYSTSSKNSKKFWKEVSKLKKESNHQELYSLGCALQNLESFVLKALKDAKTDEILTTKTTI